MSMAFALPVALPVAEAAAFTAGCALIHALRQRADGVTVALAGIVAILVLLLGIACTPEALPTAQGDGGVEETSLVQPGY
ncbi:hypothetical protein [uncultured Methylobacterium sp.]|uniref:hypothetical protein n=1 Tax=uncultured Methylobacterium sp. TaxID=157278 RepID=UPI0035CAFD44